MYMSLYKTIKEAYVKANQQDFIRSIQQENRLKWEQYWFKYWLLALVLDNALRANVELLKVHPPTVTRLLRPLDFNPKNHVDFIYVVDRNTQNTPESDNAVLPREVIIRLTKYFNACGFFGFQVWCKEDTYNYHVAIHIFDNFRRGNTLLNGVGTIIYDETQYNSATNAYGMYNISLHSGGTCGGLYVGKQFELYHDGVWSKTVVAVDDKGFLILSHTKQRLDRYLDYFARI